MPLATSPVTVRLEHYSDRKPSCNMVQLQYWHPEVYHGLRRGITKDVFGTGVTTSPGWLQCLDSSLWHLPSRFQTTASTWWRSQSMALFWSRFQSWTLRDSQIYQHHHSLFSNSHIGNSRTCISLIVSRMYTEAGAFAWLSSLSSSVWLMLVSHKQALTQTIHKLSPRSLLCVHHNGGSVIISKQTHTSQKSYMTKFHQA